MITVLAHVATLVFLGTVPRGPTRTPIRFFGADIATFVILLSVALSMFDRRRQGAPDLMANLGYSRTSLILVSLVSTIPVALLLNGIVILLLRNR